MLFLFGWVILNSSGLFVAIAHFLESFGQREYRSLLTKISWFTGFAWWEMCTRNLYLFIISAPLALLTFWVWLRFPCWTTALILCLDGMFLGPWDYFYWELGWLFVFGGLIFFFSVWLVRKLFRLCKKYLPRIRRIRAGLEKVNPGLIMSWASSLKVHIKRNFKVYSILFLLAAVSLYFIFDTFCINEKDYANEYDLAREGLANYSPRELKKEFKTLQASAEKGDLSALNKLGEYYLAGIGTKKNPARAFECFEKAANQGNQDASVNLGICYQKGYGVKRNRVKAFKIFTEIADADNPKAQYELGKCYEKGIGTLTDKWEAVLLYHKAASQNYPEAELALGDCLRNGIGTEKNLPASAGWYLHAALNGYAPAMVAIGEANRFGKGVPTNPMKSVYWFLKAANAGSPKGMWWLTVNYEGNEELPQSYDKAMYWAKRQDKIEGGTGHAELVEFQKDGQFSDRSRFDYICYGGKYEKTLDSGTPQEQYRLGMNLWNSNGEGDTHAKMAKLFERAAQANYAPAINTLGYCYLIGIGVPRDEQKAFEWFEKGANAGDAESQEWLSFCYEMGAGVKPDSKKYLYWLEKAANNRNPDALLNIVPSYVSKEMANNVYNYLATQKNADALAILAQKYETGDGVPEDKAVAYAMRKIIVESKEWRKYRTKISDADSWLEGHNPDGEIILSKLFKENEEKANAGDASYMESHGFCYITGCSGYPLDYDKGIYWLEKAADAGAKVAMERLASFYEEGTAIPRDLEKTKFWLEKAAQKGSEWAREKLEDFS